MTGREDDKPTSIHGDPYCIDVGRKIDLEISEHRFMLSGTFYALCKVLQILIHA